MNVDDDPDDDEDDEGEHVWMDEGIDRNWLQQARAAKLLGRPLTDEERAEVAAHGFDVPWLAKLVDGR